MAFENGNGNMYMPVAPAGRYVSRDEWRMDEHRSGHSIDDRMVVAMEQMYDNASSEHERMRIDEVIKHITKTGV